MAEIPRGSFIPRDPVGMVPGKVRRTRTFHVFGFISMAMLVGSIITAAGVFFLNRSAEGSLEESKQSLQKLKDNFRSENIVEIREFDRRLQAANLLLTNHISPLKLFEALEKRTKQKVQFVSLSVDHLPALEIIVELQGKTPEFKTLALQEIGFGDDALLKDIVFSEVSTSDSKEEEGSNERSILFSLKGKIAPQSIAYDGTSVVSAPQTSFVETGDSLVAVEESTNEREVLGASVTQNPL